MEIKRQAVLASIVLILVLLSGCQPKKPGDEPSLTPLPEASETTEPSESQVVTFSDSNLEAAMRNALVVEGIRRQDRALAQKPLDEPVTTAELAKLTIMEARSKHISNLSGIEYCINLNELYLTDNNIADVSSLSKLTDLIKLDLGANQIDNVSPLSALTELTDLELYRNQISDISPLSSLTDLAHLFLFRNQISDISPLSRLIKLDELDLFGNEISDISSLLHNEGLTSGDVVRLAENSLDLTPGSADMADIQTLRERGVTVVLE